MKTDKKRMKVLYVYSDHKWTGPSQPIVELCHYVSKDADVMLLTSVPKVPNTGLVSHVKTDRLKVVQCLEKRGGIGALIKNGKIVKEIIQQFQPNIIHFFRERDLAAYIGNSSKTAKIFTDFKLAYPGLLRRTICKRADVITVFSKRLANMMQNDFQKVVYIHPWLDTTEIPNKRKDIRPELGIGREDFVVGMVMRMQQHRRFDLVIEVAKIIKKSGHNIKILIFGRGPKMNDIAVEPVKKYGLEDVVIFGGYKRLDYWDGVGCFDIMLYTVAGSDGTARALRQCQVLGKPVICLKNDFFGEIVHDGIDGFLVGNDSKEIAKKIFALYFHKKMLMEFSESSAIQGKKYDLENIGQEIHKLYELCLQG